LKASRQAAKAMGDRMAFGHYLRREREERDITLTELARRVDVSIAYLSRIERERENPPPDHLISALAGALRVPPDNLFAAARRLPPDLRARTDQVIAVYRQQAAGRRR
jgi:transcriptional regulator with XRE-family HTH domain